MNRIYADYFAPSKRPARTCVGVTGLARGARVEIDLIARRPVAGKGVARTARRSKPRRRSS
jgi:2-iminobutanoate/2-iminopropanoate deaminase